jgi:Zn-dependent protease with chaperone function
MALDPRFRSPRERPLFVVGVVFSAVVWLAVVVSIVGLLYGLLIWAAILVANALFLAHVRGNGVRVSEKQHHELYARIRAASAKLGLSRTPEVFLLQGGGLLNAFATKLFSRRFVILLSDLVDQCTDPRQLDFVVGHELAHHAAGHLAWNAFLAPYHLVPLLGPAYSRAREYSCDRAGAAVAGDTEQAMRGLVVLAAGGKIAATTNLEAFMEQAAEAGSFWMAVLELGASHPYLCKRVAALKEWVAPGTSRAARRNILAYPLAPFFGIAAGSPASGGMVVVAVIGILAAIAIPNYQRYQERAQEQAAQQQLLEQLQAGAEEDEGPPSAPAAAAGEEEAAGDDAAREEAARRMLEEVRRQMERGRAEER